MIEKFQFKVTDKLELNSFVKRVWLISFIIIFVMSSMLFLPWEQTVKGKGKLVAFDPTQRDYFIVANINGYIENFYVKENEFVKKGTPLFTMTDLDKKYHLRLQENKNNTQKQFDNTKVEIGNLQKSKKNTTQNLELGLHVYEQKYETTMNKIASLKFQKQALEIEVQTKQRNFDRIATLLKEGIESKRAYDKAKNFLMKANAKLKKNVIDINIERRNLRIIEQERDKYQNEMKNKIILFTNKILAAQNRLKALSVKLNKQLSTIHRYEKRTVVAEKDGYVVRILNNDKNRFIKRGEKILYFSPIVDQRALLVQVSDFNMPLIKEGLPVRIMFYGWPALQVSGWPKIQFGSFGGIVHKIERVSHEKGFYYAYILPTKEEPWPSSDTLRVGSQATVWIRLSTVPIWYQLWRLMNAIPPKMVYPVHERKY